jgi:uncharacterized protein
VWWEPRPELGAFAATAWDSYLLSASHGRIPDMISHELLEILVCPACKQPLVYRETPESLKCTQCRRVYPVKDDIPVMLVDQATVED